MRARRLAWLAGAFFAADLVLWHNAIEQVGAGLATVLGNTQVVLVGLIAWLLWRERPQTASLVAIPIVLFGVVLISGVLEQGAYGEIRRSALCTAVLTGLAYTGFLLRCVKGDGYLGPAGPLFDATLAAAFGSAVIGLAVGDLDLTPSPSAQGWLICSRSARRCSAGS